MSEAERTHQILYSCESREELARRISKLERLSTDLLDALANEDRPYSDYGLRAKIRSFQIRSFRDRMAKLGIETMEA